MEIRIMILVYVFFSFSILFSSDGKKEEVMHLIERADSLESVDLDSALILSKQALEIAIKNKDHAGMAESFAEIGDVRIMQNHLIMAKENYLQAIIHFKKAGLKEEVGQIKLIIGNIYATQNDINEAIKYYKEALSDVKYLKDATVSGHLYNNLGEIYMQIKANKEAREYFTKGMNVFLGINDQENLMVCKANISQVLWSEGEKEKANSIALDVIQFYTEIESWRNVAEMYLLLSERYFETKDYKKARLYFNMSEDTRKLEHNEYKGPPSALNSRYYLKESQLLLVENKLDSALQSAREAYYWSELNSSPESIYKAANILSSLHEQKNNIDSAFYYHKIYLINLEKYNKEINSNDLIRISLEQEYEKLLIQEKLERKNQEIVYKSKELIYVISVTIVLLLLIFMIVRYWYNRTKAQKAILFNEKIQLEKENLKLDLEYKKKELTANMMYLYQKNEYISSVAKKLVELRDKANAGNKSEIQHLIQELNQNTKKKMWEDFEKRFIEVHSEFIDKLNSLHKDLTPNERKLCAFLRLNMSTKEISSITQQSVKSINVARSRLRKKLNLENGENVINYLSSL